MIKIVEDLTWKCSPFTHLIIHPTLDLTAAFLVAWPIPLQRGVVVLALHWPHFTILTSSPTIPTPLHLSRSNTFPDTPNPSSTTTTTGEQ